jgi:hypothetical protein
MYREGTDCRDVACLVLPMLHCEVLVTSQDTATTKRVKSCMRTNIPTLSKSILVVVNVGDQFDVLMIRDIHNFLYTAPAVHMYCSYTRLKSLPTLFHSYTPTAPLAASPAHPRMSIPRGKPIRLSLLVPVGMAMFPFLPLNNVGRYLLWMW